MRCMRCGAEVEEGAERCAACGEDLLLVILGVDQTPGDEPPPPGRSPAWRGIALTVVVAVAVGAVWLSQRGDRSLTAAPTRSPATPSLPGEAPMRFGRIFICPFGTPYQAYGSGRVYYPSNHPALPPRSERPDRCFSSPGQAETAGYSLASPPPGTRLVQGIYLVPVHLEAQCALAASRLGFGVPCPTRLPGPGVGSTGAQCGDPSSFGSYTDPPCVYNGAFFVLDQAGFATAPGSTTGVFGGPDLIFVAYRAGDRGTDAEGASLFSCPQGRQIGSTYVRPLNAPRYSPVVLVECPATYPPMSEHLILRWRDGGVVYEIAIQADPHTDRVLMQAVATDVEIIGPAPGDATADVP
jgi:hypothetical protein